MLLSKLEGFLRSKVLLELSVMNGTALSKFKNNYRYYHSPL